MTTSTCGHEYTISLLELKEEQALYQQFCDILQSLLPEQPLSFFIRPSLSNKEALKLIYQQHVSEPMALQEMLEKAQLCMGKPVLISKSYTCMPLRLDDQVIGLLWIYEALTPANCNLTAHLMNVFFHQLHTLALARIDPLSQLLNRQTFDEKVLEIASGQGFLQPREEPDPRRWYLALFDIDHFKRVNDSFGHVIGDEVILLTAQHLKENFRAEDYVFRYGGEEFAVLFQAHNDSEAQSLLDRVRGVIRSVMFPQVGQVTLSVGFTDVTDVMQVSELVNQADMALYHAKQHGRDRVVFYATLEGVSLQVTTSDIELF
ncbi:GGDEF domain-containing protein [Pseudoalteromonas rubra]|uniref:GGDEF domain-containing protein n=1 Tax=Pseudoalteromonas rubra TaxID=43658 RepID=UPI002DBCC702|nr:GGDEF domain-containing protein [Pseudoalteromonas rubra]MEC4088501.1 GGDEF domain-containing protein [Pseudoalteromonas rubra]